MAVIFNVFSFLLAILGFCFRKTAGHDTLPVDEISPFLILDFRLLFDSPGLIIKPGNFQERLRDFSRVNSGPIIK